MSGSERKKQKSDKKKVTYADAMTKVTIAQALVCAAVLLLSYLIMRSGGALYEGLKAELTYIMGKDITISEAKEAFKEFGSFVFYPSDMWQETAQKGETEETENAGGGSLPQKPIDSSLAPFAATVKASIPLKGEITSEYGFRKDPFSGETGFHSGLDIGGEEGENISAAFFGKAEKVGKHSEYGNYIILSHGGFSTLYAHCSKIYAEEGAVIRQGETIAAVGSTGLSTGPHLHFEIRRDGVRYNPAFVLGIDEI